VIELSAAPFREQADVLERLLSLPALRRCCIDAGGVGMQLAETAEQRHGPHRVEAITFTQAVKSQLAGALRLAIESRRISLPDDDRIREDLHSIRRMVTPSGNVRLDAARSSLGHGDRFWAAALAVHAAVSGVSHVERLPTGPLRFSGKGIW
jgi:phage FluMu gp28-like protein